MSLLCGSQLPEI